MFKRTSFETPSQKRAESTGIDHGDIFKYIKQQSLMFVTFHSYAK